MNNENNWQRTSKLQSTSDTWIDQSERTFHKMGDTPKQKRETQKPRKSTSHSEPPQNWDDTTKPQGTDARELTSLSGHSDTWTHSKTCKRIVLILVFLVLRRPCVPSSILMFSLCILAFCFESLSTSSKRGCARMCKSMVEVK